MSSSVFFKFRSQKEPTKITFDGTGISVFELKREIISVAGLGDGTDFDLSIYTDDSNEEYDDDTTIIPRSTTVIARRIPAQRHGHGRAARYVSGQAPVTAKNAYRTETSHAATTQDKTSSGGDGFAAMNQAQTEEEKLAAMFQADASQWEKQQQQMANAKPVFNRNYKGKPVNVPEHDPPVGYVCYRCHEKGHWIQACPTNDDPNFEAKPKVKRTTGIPNSFLKTVAKPAAVANDGLTDDRAPTGIMINAKGEYVVAEPDKASWEKFQAKAEASKEQEKAANTGSKELQDRGLECPIDKRLFVDPMKTPCCGKTYCNDCIENALVDNDLTCPNCSTPNILIDNLTADEEMRAKIKTYEEEKAAEKKSKDAEKSPALSAGTPAPTETATAHSAETSATKPASPTTSRADTPATKTTEPEGSKSPKKRPAEEELKNDRAPSGPAAMQKKNSSQGQQQQQQQKPANTNGFDQDFINSMNALAGTMPPNGQNMAAFNFPPNMGGMPFPNPMMAMGMPGMMPNGMINHMMNPMMTMGMMPNGGGFNPNMNFGGPQNGMFNNNNNNNFNQHQGWQGMNNNNMNNNNNNRQQWNGQQQQQQQGGAQGRGPQGGFANQQKTVFSEPFPNEESDAYMRRPVNPHRHQNRQRRVRPSDYTEL